MVMLCMVDVLFVSKEICEVVYGEKKLIDCMICVGFCEGGIDVC